MAGPPDFVSTPRRLPQLRDAGSRLGDHAEITLPADNEHWLSQTRRCQDCGVPFCHQGCPLGNRIPDWNQLVAQGRWREAYEQLAATNSFPEFTGRLCPAPCEAACTLEPSFGSVTICKIEKEIAECAFEAGWVEPQPPRRRTGKRVAIVGSGPAGLAAAAQLNSVGHQVTVYEAADRAGGLLRYGIPDFKLDKRVLDRRLTLLVAEGVEIRTSFAVGRDLSWRSLRADHDALLVATGAERPRDLTVPGRELGGVRFAMDFLTRQNRLSAGDEDPDPTLDASGKRVVILGGGDTGSDCLGTALRQGAASARQLELLPRPPEQRSATNQWPQWPLIMRTSSSQEEGGERDFAVLTKELTGEDGQVRKLHAARIEVRGEPGPGMEIVERPGTEFELPADMVLLAMGYTGPESGGIASELGVEIDERSNLKTGAGFETNVEGLFAAGDARRGQSLVVWAISEGREAARSVDAYLSGGESSLPARGRDLPW